MKRENFIYCILAFLMSFQTSAVFAQHSFRIGDEMKVPSTDTWNFIKQGDIGANLHTGTVNISIPFFTYKDNDFELPSSLDYSSNGFMCNMRAGILGPDWVLNAGGSISVEINGIPDLYNTSYAKGFYNLHDMENIRTDGSYWRYTNFASQSVGVGAISPEIIYIPDPSMSIINNTDKYDAEPDIFHFNFMGYSGSFHLGKNKKIYVYNTNGNNKLLDISIEAQSSFSTITITDQNGYKYFFDGSNSDVTTNGEGELKLDIGYKLTEIIAPNGRTISFMYDNYEMQNFRPGTFYYNGLILNLKDENSPETATCSVTDGHINELTNINAILCGINIDSKPFAFFNYKSLDNGEKDQYAKYSNGPLEEFYECKRLESIIITNPFDQTDTIRKANFDYITTSGARINYLNSISISGEGTYLFDYHKVKSSSFPPIGTLKVDHWGYYNDAYSSNVFLNIVSQNTSTLEENVNSSVRNPNPIYGMYGMLEKIIYPTGGYSILEYEGHDYSHAMRQKVSDAFMLKLHEENGICGGVRIKSITNYSEDNTILSSKSYSYKRDSTSSGILLYFPRYWINYSAATTLNFEENNINFYSNNLTSHDGSHIEYEMVTQTNRDGSKEIFHFSNSRLASTYRDQSDISETIPEKTPSYGPWTLTNSVLIRNIVSPIICKKAERGKLLKHEIYKSGCETPDKVTTFIYDTNYVNNVFDIHPVYLVRQFGFKHKPIDNYKLVNTIQYEYFSEGQVAQSEDIQYNQFNQISQKCIKKSNGEKEIVRYKYTSDYLNSNGFIYPSIKSQHLLSYPISELSYIADENGAETLVSGKRYSYDLYNGMVKTSSIEEYNIQNDTWYINTLYTNYDVQGNPLESIDANGLRTAYIWGYNGMYMIAKVENCYRSNIDTIIGTVPLSDCLTQEQILLIKAKCPNANITTYEHKPLVGISKIVNPNGETFSYKYNESGKLMGIYNSKGEKMEEALYSTDNKQ